MTFAQKFFLLSAAALFLIPVSQSKAQETLGGGTIASPAVGPKPAFGLGGPSMVLVKNWRFGRNGTIKNYADMSANFFYHDQFGTIANGTNYGAVIVSPDAANALWQQPIEGAACPPVRQFTDESLITLLQPLYGAATVTPTQHNAGCGSFMAKWKLPNGGSLLGQDIVWETRVRYVTPPYFWFAIWTAGNKWNYGAEQDLIESFGYDNGGGYTNFDGRYWHSNAVGSNDTTDYGNWGNGMVSHGISAYDATQYHIWTWVYKKDNSYAMYVDGIQVQGGRNAYWTFGGKVTDEPIDMDFLFDAGWGHTQIASVNKPLPASAFAGKFYEWNYSRVYLSGQTVSGSITLDGLAASAGPQNITLTFRPADGSASFDRVASIGINNAFAFNDIPAGNYTLHVRGDKYLARNLPVNAASSNVSGANFYLYTGDANNDGTVDMKDFGLLVNAFGSQASVPMSGYNAAADFSSDGTVSLADFGLLVSNYGRNGDL